MFVPRIISAALLYKVLGVASLVAVGMICHSAGGTEPRPFANYVRFMPTGPTTLDVFFEEGPFPAEFDLPSPTDPPLPGWNANAVSSISSAGGPPTIDEATLIATIPILDTNTTIAYDGMGNELGQLVLLAEGNQKLDLNADNAVVDETAGTIAVQFGGPLLEGQPSASQSVVDATGIYASDIHVLDDGLVGYARAKFLLPLDDDPATSLQENILDAFANGQIVGVEDAVGVLIGQYVPEPSAVCLFAVGGLLLVGWRRWRWSSAD